LTELFKGFGGGNELMIQPQDHEEEMKAQMEEKEDAVDDMI